MRNSIFLLLALLVSSVSVSAQSLTVTRSESAQQALEKVDNARQSTSVMGYRVGIFFDNGHQARLNATEAKELFEVSFPDQPVYMVYQSPYYKVSAGNCLTDEEAIMLFERIRKVFPNAYVMREQMAIEDFIVLPQKGVAPSLQTDSLSIEAVEYAPDAIE